MKLKRIISIILVLTMVMCLCACNSETAPKGVESDSALAQALEMQKSMTLHGNSVKTGWDPTYALEDGIDSYSVDIGDYGDEFHASYELIYGLKNKSIEGTINTAIEDKIDELLYDKSLPHMIGYALKEKEYTKDTYNIKVNVYSYLHYRLNNILSVGFYKTIIIYENYAEYSSESYYSAAALNFDLNTGEQIVLGDLFPNDFDYVSYINDYIFEYAESGGYDEEFYDEITGQYGQVSRSFETIWPDVDFYMNNYSNSVEILVNCDTPGFEFVDGYNSFTIPLNEHNAIYERFVNEDNLYLSDPCYCLQYEASSNIASDYYFEENNIDLGEYIELSDDYNNLYCSIKVRTNLPENVLEIAKEEYGDADAALDKVIDFYNETVYYDVSEPWKLNAWASHTVYSSRQGNYYNLTMFNSCDFYSYNPNNYNYYYNEYSARVFDLDGNEIKLEDIFVDGVDAKQLVMDAMYEGYIREASRNYEKGYGEWMYNIYLDYGEKLKSLTGMLYDDICGMQLNSDSITLYYNDKKGVINSWLGNKVSQEDNGFDTLNNNFAYCLYYKDLGCENLNIFN